MIQLRQPAIDEISLNLPEAELHLAGDRDLIRELAGIFHEDAPELAERFHSAIPQDNERQRISVHSLKGLCGTFCAEAAKEWLSDAEATVADGEMSEEQLRDLGENLNKVVARMRELLHEAFPE